jgi:signal transduction histidine kinase
MKLKIIPGSIMSFISEIFHPQKETAAPKEVRYHLLNKYILIFSVCGHSLFIPVFFLLNRDIPFYNNLMAVILDLFCLYLNSKYKIKTVYVLYIIEITYHTFFCNIIFGWEPGFVYYSFTLTFYIFLFRKYNILRFVMFSFVAVLFILQYIYLASYSPVYPVTIIPAWFLYFSNASANFAAIAFTAGQFSVFADRAENKILKAKDKAEEGERAKSVFLANMSHEIRSPLNSIIGMINLSLLSGKNEKESEYLNIAKNSADHLLSVINDILDYSKIEENRMKLNAETFDIHLLIKNTMIAMDSSIYDKNLSMTYEIEDNVPKNVEGDPSRLRQVLINLLSNAIKFTEKGSITVTCIKISDIDEICTLKISVRDTGTGIAENKIDEIFDRFTQVEERVSKEYTGTGLGLAISKELVELMGGVIVVKSTPGSGSIFSFQLPFKKIMQEEKSSLRTERKAADSADKTFNVLIAEDVYTNWLLYEKYMTVLGHSFKLVDNGSKVLDELEANDYDIVLMDIEMPTMNGEETLKQIRSGIRGKNKDIPVIAMTGYTESDLKKMDYRFSGFLIKPIELEDLGRRINEVMCG